MRCVDWCDHERQVMKLMAKPWTDDLVYYVVFAVAVSLSSHANSIGRVVALLLLSLFAELGWKPTDGEWRPLEQRLLALMRLAGLACALGAGFSAGGREIGLLALGAVLTVGGLAGAGWTLQHKVDPFHVVSLQAALITSTCFACQVVAIRFSHQTLAGAFVALLGYLAVDITIGAFWVINYVPVDGPLRWRSFRQEHTWRESGGAERLQDALVQPSVRISLIGAAVVGTLLAASALIQL